MNSQLPSKKHHGELYKFRQLSSETPAFHISHLHTLLSLQLSDVILHVGKTKNQTRVICMCCKPSFNMLANNQLSVKQDTCKSMYMLLCQIDYYRCH